MPMNFFVGLLYLCFAFDGVDSPHLVLDPAELDDVILLQVVVLLDFVVNDLFHHQVQALTHIVGRQ